VKTIADESITGANLTSTKTKVDSFASTARWISTNGLRYFIQFWYTKEAIFYIPAGWVPYWAEWLLSFPRAQLGSVSVQVWTVACATVVRLIGGVIVALYTVITKETVKVAEKVSVETEEEKRAAKKAN
jgi:tail-anchored protein insertion receptor